MSESLVLLVVAAFPGVACSLAAPGSRPGIPGLTWENINWIEKALRIEDSKNDDAREIPFSGDPEAVLREQFA